MKWLILALLLPSLGFTKTVSEPMNVVKMNWSSDKKMYRLTMLKHAAVYWAPKKFESCLLDSMRSNSDVSLSFDTKSLQVSDCKTLNPSK
tara:strand:- start:5814 stop:6083 length:270 start_codon:yes stop_codon:yes gene_type:complete